VASNGDYSDEFLDKLTNMSSKAVEEDRIITIKKSKADYAKNLEVIKFKDSFTEFTTEIGDEICDRIAAGELLISICEDDHMPWHRVVRKWLRSKKLTEFSAQLKEAEADRVEVFKEEIIAIADDVSCDKYEKQSRDGSTYLAVDSEVIARSKVKIEARLKHIKAGDPRWGENTSPSVIVNNGAVEANKLSDDELQREVEELRKKRQLAIGKEIVEEKRTVN
jgi:alkylated DNA nucleotide flippase Atl1